MSLGDAIDAVLLADPEHRRATRRILKRQAALHALVSDDAGWRAYLDLEQAVNERAIDAIHALARWAWKEGRKAR